MESRYKTYQMLITNGNQIIVNNKINSFGRWNGGSGEFCTNGVVYMIVGDGDFDGTVKFFNNNASVDEASTKFFNLSTNKEYKEQFKRLEVKQESPIKEQKVAKRKRKTK